jgi:hypothetical protein
MPWVVRYRVGRTGSVQQAGTNSRHERATKQPAPVMASETDDPSGDSRSADDTNHKWQDVQARFGGRMPLDCLIE